MSTETGRHLPLFQPLDHLLRPLIITDKALEVGEDLAFEATIFLLGVRIQAGIAESRDVGEEEAAQLCGEARLTASIVSAQQCLNKEKVTIIQS